jgi:hypothetical protein
MSEDAIQEDVSDVEDHTTEATEAEQPKRVDPREAMYEKMDRERYAHDGLEYDDKEEEQAEPEVSERKRDEQGRFTAQEQEPEKVAEEPKYRVKVDGEEAELPLSEILKGYQKDATASRRLEEAAKLRAQLEDDYRKLQELRESVKSPAPTPEVVEDPKVKAKRLYDSLMLGSEHDGIDALTEFLAPRREPERPAISAEQVASKAAEQARIQLEFKLAEREFRKEYKDLAGDEDLYQMTMQYLQKTAPESATYDEAFQKAGEATRNWVKARAEKFGYVQKQDVPAVDERAERKQSLDNVKTARARVPAPKEEREPTAAEIIRDMRKARGLTV